MIKHIIASIFASLFMMMPASACFAEAIEGGGGQTRGYPGHNAELTGKKFTLPRPGNIIKVEGEGTAGFWIENTRNGSMVAQFDSFAEANGFALSAGSYRIFPNLKDGRDSAWVRITVNCP